LNQVGSSIAAAGAAIVAAAAIAVSGKETSVQ
jgi:hypothetical protein